MRLSSTAYRFGVRYRVLLVLAVEAGGDPVVEGKGVPGEPAFRLERGGDPTGNFSSVAQRPGVVPHAGQPAGSPGSPQLVSP